MARFIAAVLLFSVLALPTGPSSAQNSSATDILKTVSEYVSTYASKISSVTLHEDYTLLDVTGGRVVSTRRISSDLVLFDLNGRPVALRDPFAIDDNPLREHAPRIAALLAKPSQTAYDQAQAYANESVRYFQDEMIIRLNNPMLVFGFLDPANQARSTFKIDGKKKFDGVEAVGLGFQETKVKPPSYIVETPGKAWGRGKFWVEPATGRILRTELTMQSETEQVRITVDYKRDPALDAWLPSAMVDTYEITERVGPGISTMGSGAPGIARRSFDCRATYARAHGAASVSRTE